MAANSFYTFLFIKKSYFILLIILWEELETFDLNQYLHNHLLPVFHLLLVVIIFITIF